MHKKFRTSFVLRAFTWDDESASLKIVYRNLDEITFFNISDEVAELFMKAIFKVRFIKVIKSNPAIPYNLAKNRLPK